MESIVEVIMSRDGASLEDVMEMIQEAKQMIRSGSDPQDVLQEVFGLEPDYIYDLF